MTTSRLERLWAGGLAVAAAIGLVAVVPAAVNAAEERFDYTFEFENGITLEGSSSSKVTFLADAGGTSVDNPTGMDVHLSCSDQFSGGWGEKDGPTFGVDTAWKLSAYQIFKFKDGKIDKSCGDDDLGSQPPSGEFIMFTFNFVNGITIEGMSEDNTAFLPNAGGPSVDDPTGMDVHVSCSDEFPGGWGEKDGPDQAVDTAWQIESYSIKKIKDGQIDKTCGDDFGPPPGSDPEIDIEKSVNGHDADDPPGPEFVVGETVTFDYVVTNIGDVELREVAVLDATLGPIGCPQDILDVGESMTCDPHSEVVVEPGPVFMESRVDAVGAVSGPGVTDPIPAAGDGHLYSFTFVNGITISGSSDDNTVFLPNAGGSSVDNPTGMQVHVSCSDDFPGGWGEKDGPDQAIDTAWRISSYEIVKHKDGEVDKRCGDAFSTIDQPVSDTDPVNFVVVSPKVPSIDIEKSVNGDDADDAPGPSVRLGGTLKFVYVVTNTGDTLLDNVVVTDSVLGAIPCTVPPLGPGGSYTCPSVFETATSTGSFSMEGTVTGEAPDGTTVTDTDPVNFTVRDETNPSIDIEKSVNGDDADDPPGPAVPLGGSLKFVYVVTNTGDTVLDDILVTDSVLGAIPCTVPPLGPGGSYTCPSVFETASSTGSFFMEGTVSGDSPAGTTVTDTDPVNFTVGDDSRVPSIDIEKSVNGDDADVAPGPQFRVGNTLKFVYVVTNTGDTLLDNVVVTDSVLGAIPCTVPPLGPGGSYTCPSVFETASSTGSFFMEGTVSGDSPAGTTVTDTDPVNFTIVPDTRVPSIDIEKSVNGDDADGPPGAEFQIGDQLTFVYVVTNTGDTLLDGVVVTDSVLGAIPCTVPPLGPGGSYTCPNVVETATTAGNFFMEATVTGDAPDGTTVTDTDPVNFTVVDEGTAG